MKWETATSENSWQYIFTSAIGILAAIVLTASHIDFFVPVKGFSLGDLPPFLIYFLALNHILLALVFTMISPGSRANWPRVGLKLVFACLLGALFYNRVSALLGIAFLVSLRVWVSLTHVFYDEIGFGLAGSGSNGAVRFLGLNAVLGLALGIMATEVRTISPFLSVWLATTPIMILYAAWIGEFGKNRERSRKLAYVFLILYLAVLFCRTPRALIFAGTASFMYHILHWYIRYAIRLRERTKSGQITRGPIIRRDWRYFLGFVALTHLALLGLFLVGARTGALYSATGWHELFSRSVYFARSGSPVLGLLFDHRMYSFWLIFHAVMSWEFLNSLLSWVPSPSGALVVRVHS